MASFTFDNIMNDLKSYNLWNQLLFLVCSFSLSSCNTTIICFDELSFGIWKQIECRYTTYSSSSVYAKGVGDMDPN